MTKDDKRLLKIGELADATGKSQRAIHFYEELGILRPVTRSTGGFRLYSHDALERALWIGKLQGMGFKLSEIKQVLADWEHSANGPQGMSRVRAVFQSKLAETRAGIERLRILEKELHDSLLYLDSCNTCAPSHAINDCVVCDQKGLDPNQVPSLVAGLSRGDAEAWDVDRKALVQGN